jgi:hypothetical protein
MNQYIIVWSHRHGVDVILFKTTRKLSDFSDEAAWEILKELEHDVEPEREFIEAFTWINIDAMEILP